MTRLRPVHAYLILAAAVLIFFGRLTLCDFTWWDDGVTIHQNPRMNPVRLDTFIHDWTKPTMQIYIPLTYTVWALVASVARVQSGEFGITLNPYFFHATNIIVHLLGAWAAWQLLRRLVKNDLAALLGALLWAVHPVQVESVGWVSGLKDVLAGALTLASLWQYVRWRQEHAPPAYWIAFALYVLAMLAKPSAMTTPLLLIAIDMLALGRSWRQTLGAVAPFLIAAAPIAVIARLCQPPIGHKYDLWLGPLIAGDSLAFYMVKIIAPVHLAFDYGHSPDAIRATGELWYGWLLPAIVMAVAVIAMLTDQRRARPVGALPLLAIALFALAPLHVLGFIQYDFERISTVSDHYLYVSMIGPALLLAWAVGRYPRWLTAPAILAIGAYGVRSMLQTPVWQNERSLMNHALAINPKSWTAYTNLAGTADQAGDFAEAHANLLKAEAINDRDALVESGLLALDLRFERYASAEQHAQKLIRGQEENVGNTGPDVVPAYLRIIDAYINFRLLDEAEKYVQEALRRDPNSRDLHYWADHIRWMRLDPNYPVRTVPKNPSTAPGDG